MGLSSRSTLFGRTARPIRLRGSRAEITENHADLLRDIETSSRCLPHYPLGLTPPAPAAAHRTNYAVRESVKVQVAHQPASPLNNMDGGSEIVLLGSVDRGGPERDHLTPGLHRAHEEYRASSAPSADPLARFRMRRLAQVWVGDRATSES